MVKKMLKRDFVGRKARLRREISNGAGTILDAGEIVKIDGTYRGRFSIDTITTCNHCYRRKRVGISQVSENDFELIDEAQVTHSAATATFAHFEQIDDSNAVDDRTLRNAINAALRPLGYKLHATMDLNQVREMAQGLNVIEAKARRADRIPEPELLEFGGQSRP